MRVRQLAPVSMQHILLRRRVVFSIGKCNQPQTHTHTHTNRRIYTLLAFPFYSCSTAPPPLPTPSLSLELSCWSIRTDSLLYVSESIIWLLSIVFLHCPAQPVVCVCYIPCKYTCAWLGHVSCKLHWATQLCLLCLPVMPNLSANWATGYAVLAQIAFRDVLLT